jgi:hypothetical protein
MSTRVGYENIDIRYESLGITFLEVKGQVNKTDTCTLQVAEVCFVYTGRKSGIQVYVRKEPAIPSDRKFCEPEIDAEHGLHAEVVQSLYGPIY